MIGNNFYYGFLDGSYILTRNLWVATKDKTIQEMDPGEVVRITIQTINKLYRDWNCSPEKTLLIFDEWDKSIGGYIRSWMISNYVQYKGSRVFMTRQILEDMKKDPNTKQEDIEKAERELAINNVKFIAKRIMKEEFKKIGLPYFSWPGWEFDDIATLASFMLNGRTEKPNVIITKDSDLSYSLCPGCYQFLIPTKGSDPRFISYDEMYNQIPQELRDRGVSLYQYHSFCDSLGISGHNDNLKTIKPRRDGVKTILHILDGDYSDVEKPEAFEAQMKSFDLSLFPGLNEVQEMIITQFPKAGHLGTLDEFKYFCKNNSVSGISDKYYTDFINRFDQKLFSE